MCIGVLGGVCVCALYACSPVSTICAVTLLPHIGFRISSLMDNGGDGRRYAGAVTSMS